MSPCGGLLGPAAHALLRIPPLKRPRREERDPRRWLPRVDVDLEPDPAGVAAGLQPSAVRLTLCTDVGDRIRERGVRGGGAQRAVRHCRRSPARSKPPPRPLTTRSVDYSTNKPTMRDAASANITSAMNPSSTRQATGFANKGRSARLPKPSAVNQRMLPVTAPRANHQR